MLLRCHSGGAHPESASFHHHSLSNLFPQLHLSWAGNGIPRNLTVVINSVQGISEFGDFQVKSKQIGLKFFPLSESSWALRLMHKELRPICLSVYVLDPLNPSEWVESVYAFFFIVGDSTIPRTFFQFLCYSERLLFVSNRVTGWSDIFKSEAW